MSELRTTTSRVPDFLELLDRYPEDEVLHVPQLSFEQRNKDIEGTGEGSLNQRKERAKDSRKLEEFQCGGGGGI